MLASEKKALYRFLTIYLISTISLFLVASYIFYNSAKEHLIRQQKEILKREAQTIETKLRELHKSNKKVLLYPNSSVVESAIFDLDKNYIFGSFKNRVSLDNLDKSRLNSIIQIEPYYLGAAYLLVSKKIDKEPIIKLQHSLIFFMIIAVAIFLFLGYFLGKLFIKPLKEAIEQKNHFIQDATHELNTPISIILTNIELIEVFNKCKDAKEELKRVEIASKTLSRIYDDLTYINFHHKVSKSIKKLDISKLLKQRVEYFYALAKAKHLEVNLEIKEQVYLNIDKNDAIRLIDNLISNAIKYNRHNGVINIYLDKNKFVVSDSGIGINKKDLAKITDRFKRANSSEGGFGIGLNIVSLVAKEYNFKLNITSTLNKGTEVTILW